MMHWCVVYNETYNEIALKITFLLDHFYWILNNLKEMCTIELQCIRVVINIKLNTKIYQK